MLLIMIDHPSWTIPVLLLGTPCTPSYQPLRTSEPEVQTHCCHPVRNRTIPNTSVIPSSSGIHYFTYYFLLYLILRFRSALFIFFLTFSVILFSVPRFQLLSVFLCFGVLVLFYSLCNYRAILRNSFNLPIICWFPFLYFFQVRLFTPYENSQIV